MTTPKKPKNDTSKDGMITLPVVGTVSFRTAAIILLFFSTDMGQRMLDNWGVMKAQSAELSEIRRDVAEIKKQVASLTTDVGEIKSLAGIKKKALESVANK